MIYYNHNTYSQPHFACSLLHDENVVFTLQSLVMVYLDCVISCGIGLDGKGLFNECSRWGLGASFAAHMFPYLCMDDCIEFSHSWPHNPLHVLDGPIAMWSISTHCNAMFNSTCVGHSIVLHMFGTLSQPSRTLIAAFSCAPYTASTRIKASFPSHSSPCIHHRIHLSRRFLALAKQPHWQFPSLDTFREVWCFHAFMIEMIEMMMNVFNYIANRIYGESLPDRLRRVVRMPAMAIPRNSDSFPCSFLCRFHGLFLVMSFKLCWHRYSSVLFFWFCPTLI